MQYLATLKLVHCALWIILLFSLSVSGERCTYYFCGSVKTGGSSTHVMVTYKQLHWQCPWSCLNDKLDYVGLTGTEIFLELLHHGLKHYR